MLRRLNLSKICQFCYEGVVLLTLAVLILAPLHLRATRHFSLTKIYNSTTVSFLVDSPTNLSRGDILPVYRFQGNEKLEIGRVKVSELRNREVICILDPKELRWPIGRHGSVVAVNWPSVTVDLGARDGFKEKNHLILFLERKRIGSIELTKVFTSFSEARVINSLSRNLKGAIVSEFTVATQVAFFKHKLLSFFEVFFFLLVFISYAYFFLFRRQSLFILFGRWFHAQFKRLPRKTLISVLNLFLSIPFVWFIVTFFVVFIAHFLPAAVNPPALNKNMLSLYLLAAAIYFYVLFRRRRSPILVFWEWMSFRPTQNRFFKGYWRDAVIWFLHLIIAYAFGRSLFLFLKANLTSIFNILSRPPHIASLGNAFSVARYLLWSITIVGCILGYAHSILGYFWGKRIRNLDFTVMGWLTNAFCYGPLLGIVIWQMVPSFVGRDPIVTQGPLYFLVLVVTAKPVLYADNLESGNHVRSNDR